MANIQPRRNKDGKIISYSIRVFKGRDANGKQLKPHTMTFEIPEKWSEEKAEKEAAKAAILFEKQCKDGIVVDNNQTFEKYAKYVIQLKERSGVKHKTIYTYNILLERIIPAIGHIKLKELRPQHLNLFYEQLASEGMNKNNNGRLSAATITKYHRLIATILSNAEKEMLVEYNAASKVSPPKIIKKDANYLEIKVIEQILSYIPNEKLRWQVVMLLLIFSGARRSEIAGIKMKNINIKNNSVAFREGIFYTKEKGIYVDELKTEKSKRTLKLPVLVMDVIKKLILQNRKNKLKYGSAWNDNDFLLTQDNGNPIHPDSITDYCEKFRTKYNKIIKENNKKKDKTEQEELIPHINPHAFRHSQASMLFFSGADPITVSRRLGHAQVSTTTDIYSHILETADENASNTLENLLISKKLN